MNEDFVTYELADKLKEKGFNEPCYGYYHRDGGDDSFEVCGNGTCDFLNSKNIHRIAAPTISQVLKWLRKEKKIFLEIVIVCNGVDAEYMCDIYKINPAIECLDSTGYFKTYELTALAGIEYVLDKLI